MSLRRIDHTQIKESAQRGVAHLYVVVEEGSESPVKVGFARNAKWRLTELQCGNPRKLRLLGVWEGDRASVETAERHIHRAMSDARLVREWFNAEFRAVFALVEGLK